MTIKNLSYRQFLDTGMISLVDLPELDKGLANIKGKNINEARALVIVLYYTGARPAEVLELSGKDITKENNYVKVALKGVKHGLPRTVYIPLARKYITELYKYAVSTFPDQYLFFNFRGSYSREYTSAKGKINTNIETTDKLRYHFKKWFANVVKGGLTPYFLRHNRFSKLAMSGASDTDIQMIKGARSIESVQPYKHLSKKTAIDMAKKIK